VLEKFHRFGACKSEKKKKKKNMSEKIRRKGREGMIGKEREE
jgi:hypothetical protein